MVAAYAVKGDSFIAEKPRLWSETQLSETQLANPSGNNYDLAPDGKRIAAIMPAGGPGEEHHVLFLQNFFDELRRRVAAGGKN